MTKLEALAQQSKAREQRAQSAVDGLRAAMGSDDAALIEAAIGDAKECGVGKEQIAHAESHLLTVRTIRLLQEAIEGRTEAGLRAALETSASRLREHLLDVRSREYHDRHQQAKATLDQLLAVSKVLAVESDVVTARKARAQRAAKRSTPLSEAEEGKEEAAWAKHIDSLRDAIAAARLLGARDTDMLDRSRADPRLRRAPPQGEERNRGGGGGGERPPAGGGRS